MTDFKTCPRCELVQDMEFPALSRRYNIDICSRCGQVEAVNDMLHIMEIEFDSLGVEAKFCAKNDSKTYGEWLEWKNQIGLGMQ